MFSLMRYALLHLDYSTRLTLFIVIQFFVYYWTRYVVAPAKVGWNRILRAIPVLTALYLACLCFQPRSAQEYALTLTSAATGLWIGGSKVLALCFNRGQLMKSYEAGNNYAFGIGLLFPVVVAFEEKPVGKKDGDEKKRLRTFDDVEFRTVVLSRKPFYTEVAQLTMHLVIKILAMNALESLMQYLSETGHLASRDFGAGWFAYLLTSFTDDMISLVSTLLFNLKIKPAFNNPFVAQSITELWSQRYNLAYGEALRDTVYDPICERRLMPGSKYFKERPTRSLQVVALFMTFVMSGFCHAVAGVIAFDMAFPYLYGLFFVANGVVVILEGLIKSILKKTGYYASISSSIPSFVYIAYMTGVIFYLNYIFFMPEIKANGIDKLMLQASVHKFGIFP